MKMSKMGKKVMALVSAIAMILSLGSYICAGTVKAAEEPTAPTVKMLGATLRTDNETGYQSIRVGIEVTGASKAGACGIKLSLNGNEAVVSTDNANFRKVYSKDEKTDKIVYTVVVTKIPVASASAKIDFTGFVKELGSEAETSTEKISESVDSVIESVGHTIGKDVFMLKDGEYAGTLVYEYAKLDMTEAKSNLQDENTEGSYSAGHFVVGKNEARATSEYVMNEGEPYYKIKTPAKKVVATAAPETTSGPTYNDGDYGKGMGYIHASMSEADDYIYSAEVKAEQGVKICLEHNTAFNTWSGSAQGGKILSCDNTWHTFQARLSSKEGYNNSNYITIYCDGDKEYCIKNFVIYKPVSESDVPGITAPPTGWNEDHTEYTLKLDSNSITTANQWATPVTEFEFNQDGSVLVKNSADFGIILPEEIYKNNKFEKALISYSGVQSSVNYVVKYDTSNPNYAEGEDSHYWPPILEGSSGTSTITPNPNYSDKNMSAIRIFNNKNTQLLIKSVVFVKAAE